MEKEFDRNSVVLKEDSNAGVVQIADDVVAMIASLAAAEIDGVHVIAGNLSNEIMSKVGMKKLTRGVKIEILGAEIKVALVITMDYGYNIPATCEKVQEKVKNAIENMTGLKCTVVHVRIAAINTNN